MDNKSYLVQLGPIRIGVVIVAYASGSNLLDCLSGVLADGNVTSVVIVDNSSDAQSKLVVERLASNDSRLHYLDPRVNLGFAKGCNAGVAQLQDCTHLFFVNPDVQLRRPLLPLIVHLEASPQVIVAGRLVSQGHPLSINSRPLVSIRRELVKALVGTRAYFGVSSPKRGWQCSTPHVVGQVDGALLGMSSGTYATLGGFDPQFELYFEDVDICARAKPLGGCLFVPVVWGEHAGGASSSTVSEMAYCVGAISRARYFRKHFGRSSFVTFLILSVALIEFSTRSLTRQSEGAAARVKSIRLQLREATTPGSVVLLQAQRRASGGVCE